MIYKKQLLRYNPLWTRDTFEYTVNLWVVYILWHDNGFGWARLFGRWYGVHCKPKSEPLIFSERLGHTKSWVIGGYRFKILKPYSL